MARKYGSAASRMQRAEQLAVERVGEQEEQPDRRPAGRGQVVDPQAGLHAASRARRGGVRSRPLRCSLGRISRPPLAQRRRWIDSAPKSGGVARVAEPLGVVEQPPAVDGEVDGRLGVLDDGAVLHVAADLAARRRSRSRRCRRAPACGSPRWRRPRTWRRGSPCPDARCAAGRWSRRRSARCGSPTRGTREYGVWATATPRVLGLLAAGGRAAGSTRAAARCRRRGSARSRRPGSGSSRCCRPAAARARRPARAAGRSCVPSGPR